MSHELEMNADGTAQMAYRKAGGLPWHGLGVALENDATPEQMMIAAQLDWSVEKTPNFIQNPQGEFVETGTYSLVRDRDQKIMTQITEGWNPTQNAEAFDFFHDFVEKGDMMMESAGSLFDGNIVWAQAKLNDGFKVFGEDEIKGYLLFTNPHQYGKTINIKFCATRTVCNNTLTLALSEKGQREVRVSHSKKFDAGRVKEMMGLADVQLNRFKEASEFLGSVRVTREGLEEYFGELFGVNDDKELKRNGRVALAAVESQPGTEFAEGSYWQAFNAVTYCTNHLFGRKQDNRLNSLWYGSAENLNTAALNLALEKAARAA